LDTVSFFKAVALGVVEGLTEFLPISSTGHLIIAEHLLFFQGEKAKVFTTFIQLGAILAVCWEYRLRLIRAFTGIPSDRGQLRFVVNLGVAFLPAGILGLIFGKHVKQYLFHPLPVASAFILGGIVILWLERRKTRKVYIQHVDDLRIRDALLVGFAQALALFPGTSRSGATIIGGMFFGLSRQAATEFSFFLALPTLSAAALYDLWKQRDILTSADLPFFAVGFLAAFGSAILAVRGLIRYVAHHDFSVFAWYRIVFGGLVLVSAWMGWISWTAH